MIDWSVDSTAGTIAGVIVDSITVASVDSLVDATSGTTADVGKVVDAVMAASVVASMGMMFDATWIKCQNSFYLKFLICVAL